MFAECFAVVAGRDDQRVFQQVFFFEQGDDGANIMIHISDLAVIGIFGKIAAIGFRWVVGGMGIEKMDP